MDGSGEWRTTFRPDIPSSARIYDYLLGGKDNYQADRRAAEVIVGRLPNARQAVRWNRGFLRRVVRYLVGEAGIRYVLDRRGHLLPADREDHDIGPRCLSDRARGRIRDEPARKRLERLRSAAVAEDDVVARRDGMAGDHLREGDPSNRASRRRSARPSFPVRWRLGPGGGAAQP